MSAIAKDETLPQLLTVKDMCAMGFSRDVAYCLMHARGFPSMKIGGKFYVTKTALEKWLNKQEGREFAL